MNATSAAEALSLIQVARLRQFVDQTDARLLLMMAGNERASEPGRVAEIERLEGLRNLALTMLAEAGA